ncbi:hypothetical protein N7490_000019 [Penicillium lividum]|nr:hypothetical protein N7490_000019 [Penicillium lividum]
MSKLFTPLRIGRTTLNQRIAMAPMTRLRADHSHLPLPYVTDYYQQRASVPGSLVITEATVVSIYNDSQIAAWKNVTDAIHAKGSHIYLQLWALGRAANPEFLERSGHKLVSSSDVPMKSAFSDDMHYPTPMTDDEIRNTISDFVKAAENATLAGFDGVEIYGAKGYLVNQFLQDVSIIRNEKWGGSIENRSSFVVKMTKAVANAIGNDRTAIRFSPWSRYQGMRMSDPIPQFSDVVQRLADLKLAYLHACESDVKDEGIDWLLKAYGNASSVLLAGNHNGESAKETVDNKYPYHDIVLAFGRQYIANPDLPLRIKKEIPFAPFHSQNVY